MCKTYNDLVYTIARRVAELGNMKMDALREAAGYDVDTPYQAREAHKYKNRGELLELIITEEFIGEFDKEFTD